MPEASTIELDHTSLPSLGSLFLRSLLPRHRPEDLSSLPEILIRALPLDPEHLAGYRRVCGFPESDFLPLPYFFVVGFLPQVMLITEARFPLRALGMVHVANHFEYFELIGADDHLDIRVRAIRMETVEKGRQIEIETVFHRDQTLVARSVSLNFAHGSGHGIPPERSERVASPEAEPSRRWNLDPKTGRRYARVSGDYNPIHLYPWSARLLGFRRPIAHGMYLVSRAVAELESERSPKDEPLRSLEVRFKTPTFLPGRARLYLSRRGVAHAFQLWDQKGRRPHLMGECCSKLAET